MSVIDFAAAKLERSPHSAGARICLGCQHEWIGVAPLGVNASLKCPECGLPKGVTKNLYGADVGEMSFLCNCGCEVMFARRRMSGRTHVHCIACGEDQTEAIFAP